MGARIGVHLALSIVWCLLTGSFTEWNLLAGLLVGLVVVSVYTHAADTRSYARRLADLVLFAGWFGVLLVRSNMQIAREILTPGWTQSPRILRYDVSGLSAVQSTVLANAFTLTPGTLALDVSEDGTVMYLHCMYAKDREAQVRELDVLRERMERWVFGR